MANSKLIVPPGVFKCPVCKDQYIDCENLDKDFLCGTLRCDECVSWCTNTNCCHDAEEMLLEIIKEHNDLTAENIRLREELARIHHERCATDRS